MAAILAVRQSKLLLDINQGLVSGDLYVGIVA